MENKKRYFIIGGISAILIIIAIIVVIVCNRPNNEKTNSQETNTLQVNKSEQLAAPRKYEELDVITAKLTATNKAVEFVVEIKNNTNKEIAGHTVQIVMIDENGNELGKMLGYLSTVKPAETVKLSASGSGNMVMGAFDYKMERK